MEREKLVREIGRKHELSEKALVYLDSVAWQISENVGGCSADELETIVQIAKGYEAPERALQAIDNAMPEYFVQVLARKAGSFGELFEKEEKARKKLGRLTLKGLETRIEEYLLGIKISEPNYTQRTASKDDTSPWQENAIRALEGD